MNQLKTKALVISFIAASIFAISGEPAFASSSGYGAGAYGQCAYSEEGSTCSISISNTNGNPFFLNLAITPAQSGQCTVASDSVAVTTSDPNGYTLTLGDQATPSDLINGSYSIPTDSSNLTSPGPLGDTWGYHINNGSFTGTASAQSNASLSSISSWNYFAGLQPSNLTADTINTTSTYNGSADTTTVWYGICMDYNIAVPTGSYSSTVIYTATAN